MFQTFEEASKFISLNKQMAIKDDEKLMLYALYKMAIVGKPPVKEFGMFETKEKLKYNAWLEFSNAYQCEHAEELYISFANKLYEKYLSPNK